VIRLFCGFDEREEAGYHVFAGSVIRRASQPVAFMPLTHMGMPRGTNTFTFSRFLVPWLCGRKGRAIFADASDMIMLQDVATLDSTFDPKFAVQVVKHKAYETRHPIKYLGTPMEAPNKNYERKNWVSLMVVNCEHHAWDAITPAYVARAAPLDLLQLQFLEDSHIGELPPRWNCLVDEGQACDEAAILHWTTGIPAFKRYRSVPRAEMWFEERDKMMGVT